MQIKEVLQFLSDNHIKLILLGGAISFISLFLPFWDVLIVGFEAWMRGNTAQSLNISISHTWIFWIYLILIIALYYGYVKGYGVKYPYLFLIIGSFLLLLTIYAYQLIPRDDAIDVRHSYGLFFEFISSQQLP